MIRRAGTSCGTAQNMGRSDVNQDPANGAAVDPYTFTDCKAGD
ncbi:hypothetical protein GCM10020218_064480 [Dactylosporangium vinaceum]